jgi:tetratricopeptide (TPR) repeat protein
MEAELSPGADVDHLVAEAIGEGRWEDARAMLQTALASIPSDWRALEEDNGRVRGAFWDQEEFLAFVTRHREEYKTPIVWIGPSYSKMWWQLAVVNGEQERFDEALECLTRALALEPDHPRLWVEKGFLLNRLGRHEAALEGYRTAATIRGWTPQFLVARSLRGQGSALIDLERFEDARHAYRKSLELDPESGIARQELEYIDRVLKEHESKKLPWFLNCIKNPPSDPLTKQLLALVDGLESVPGPRTIGSENYAKVSEAFLSRGWDGFEKAFDAIVPRTRSDYVDVKRELLREPIFNPRVHSRMTRIFLKRATIDEVTTEIENERKPDRTQ